jgi:hypothetical protein
MTSTMIEASRSPAPEVAPQVGDVPEAVDPEGHEREQDALEGEPGQAAESLAFHLSLRKMRHTPVSVAPGGRMTSTMIEASRSPVPTDAHPQAEPDHRPRHRRTERLSRPPHARRTPPTLA